MRNILNWMQNWRFIKTGNWGMMFFVSLYCLLMLAILAVLAETEGYVFLGASGLGLFTHVFLIHDRVETRFYVGSEVSEDSEIVFYLDKRRPDLCKQFRNMHLRLVAIALVTIAVMLVAVRVLPLLNHLV